jgi:apolipoprotein N-acyltransferase
MKNVPHWQLFMLIYFALVAVPVMVVHYWMKKKVLAQKTALNLLLYFAAVVGAAFLMHFLVMLLYFEFLFRK